MGVVVVRAVVEAVVGAGEGWATTWRHPASSRVPAANHEDQPEANRGRGRRRSGLSVGRRPAPRSIRAASPAARNAGRRHAPHRRTAGSASHPVVMVAPTCRAPVRRPMPAGTPFEARGHLVVIPRGVRTRPCRGSGRTRCRTSRRSRTWLRCRSPVRGRACCRLGPPRRSPRAPHVPTKSWPSGLASMTLLPRGLEARGSRSQLGGDARARGCERGGARCSPHRVAGQGRSSARAQVVEFGIDSDAGLVADLALEPPDRSLDRLVGTRGREGHHEARGLIGEVAWLVRRSPVDGDPLLLEALDERGGRGAGPR